MADPLSKRTKSVPIWAPLTAIFAGVTILAIKYQAAIVSGSAALRSDAIEGVVNVMTAVFSLGAVIFAKKPADREHPYGHGKIENFSAAFEGGLITLAAAFIAWEAVSTLHEQFVLGIFRLRDINQGLIWFCIAGGLNGALGLFLFLMGKWHRSKAVEADGQHVLSDFWTTLGILIGMLLVKTTGLYWLDPLMALLVAILLAWTGFKLVHQSSKVLLDIEDPNFLENLIEVMNRVRTNHIIGLHDLKTIRSGRHTHVDIHVVMPGHYPLIKAHDIADDFEKAVIAQADIEGELHIHFDPCRQSCCKDCAVDDCSMRRGSMGALTKMTLESSIALGEIQLISN